MTQNKSDYYMTFGDGTEVPSECLRDKSRYWRSKEEAAVREIDRLNEMRLRYQKIANDFEFAAQDLDSIKDRKKGGQ